MGCPRRRAAFPNCTILSAVRPSQSAYPSAKVRLIELFLYSLDELFVMKMAAKIHFYHKIHSSQSSIITSLSAVKLGPTPAGVRDTIKSGTPNTQKLAKGSLQRHQAACQQKVARAEERDPSHPRADKRPRILAKHAATQARHHKQKKDTEKGTVNAEEERRILE